MNNEDDVAVREIAAFLQSWSERYDRGWILVFDRPNGSIAVLQAPSTDTKAVLEEIIKYIDTPINIDVVRVPKVGKS